MTGPAAQPQIEAVRSRHAPGTLGFVVDRWSQQLSDAGIESPRLDARVLATAAIDQPPEFVLTHGEVDLDDKTQAAIDASMARRLNGEPVARILGIKEFWSLDFHLAPETLVLRPETEFLVQTALDILDQHKKRDLSLRILDLGCGSGCILLALLSHRFG